MEYESRADFYRTRRESTPPDEGHQIILDQSHSWRVSATPTPNWANNPVPQPPVLPAKASTDSSAFGHNGVENHSQSSTSPASGDGRVWPDLSAGLTWDQNPLVDASSASCDFSHLTDLDDIFTFTGNTFLPALPQAAADYSWNVPPYAPPNQLSPPPILPGPSINGTANIPPRRPSVVHTTVHIPGLNPRDHEYLRGEGCFDLPPAYILRQMMQMYFRMNHPNLPIVAEDQFWSLWSGDEYRVGDYSFLLLRAMIFAATCVSMSKHKLKRRLTVAVHGTGSAIKPWFREQT